MLRVKFSHHFESVTVGGSHRHPFEEQTSQSKSGSQDHEEIHRFPDTEAPLLIFNSLAFEHVNKAKGTYERRYEALFPSVSLSLYVPVSMSTLPRV